MTADGEDPRVTLRIKAEALAVDLEKYLTGKQRKEVRDMPESRSKGDNSNKGEVDRDLLGWLALLIALVVAWFVYRGT